MIFMAFVAGVVELLMGVFKLGFLVDFIPMPVTSAFTSATSMIIISTQLKTWFGISFSSKGFIATILGLGQRLSEFRIGDFTIGGVGILTLLILRKIDTIPLIKHKRHGAKIKKFLWYVSISRNALVVLVSSIVAYNWIGKTPFKLSGTVESGIPTFQIPDFTMVYDNKTMSFTDNLKEMGSGILLLPLVAVLANVAIAKSFCEYKLVY
jgi:sodium-independent sulfate anion transporter 11